MVALSSAIVSGPSDVGVGAGLVVENVFPQSSGGKAVEALPHFCADSVGKKRYSTIT